MMMKLRIATALAFVLLGACSTLVPPSPVPPRMDARTTGAELIGRTIRLETSGGQVTNMRFSENGVVRAQFGSSEIVGSWVSTGTQLCFAWTGSSRECWPYARPLTPGETVTLTSDRGNVVRVTLQ
jgi:hypothetical protein